MFSRRGAEAQRRTIVAGVAFGVVTAPLLGALAALHEIPFKLWRSRAKPRSREGGWGTMQIPIPTPTSIRRGQHEQATTALRLDSWWDGDPG